MPRKLLPEPENYVQCNEQVTTYQERSDHLRHPRNFGQKLKFWSKIEILVQNFGQNNILLFS